MYNFKKEELFTHSCLGSAKTFNPVFPSSDAAATGQTWCGENFGKESDNFSQISQKTFQFMHGGRSVGNGGDFRSLSHIFSHILKTRVLIL